MSKLRYLIASLGLGLTACVSPNQYSQPKDLRFQDKSLGKTQIIDVVRDHKLCATETSDNQNCPINFYLNDIKAGSFYINNAAEFRLKPEIYHLKVRNCTDKCSVCETEINPAEIKDRKIILSVDANGLPLILNTDNQLICETPKTKLTETTVQVNLAADTLFKFDGSSLNDLLPKGHQEVLDVASKISQGYVSVSQINLIGHTDRLGHELYNLQLGQKRAETVRDVLVQNGISKNIISTKSVGEKEPVTEGCYGVEPQEALRECLQPDRRVTVEITGIAK